MRDSNTAADVTSGAAGAGVCLAATAAERPSAIVETASQPACLARVRGARIGEPVLCLCIGVMRVPWNPRAATRMRGTTIPLCMRRPAAVLLILSVLLASAMAGMAQSAQPDAPPRPADELPVSRLKADATVSVPLAPGAAAAEGALWTATPTGVVRVDAATNLAAPAVALTASSCASLAWGLKALWVPQCAARTVARVDAESKAVTAVAVPVADPAGSIAVGVGSIWAASDASGVVSRIDPDTREVVGEVFVGREPAGVAFADDVLWVTSAATNTVTRIEPYTNTVVEAVTTGPRPGRVVAGEGAVWTLNRGDSSVTRVDPKTNKAVTTIAVGHDVGAGDLAVGLGSVWLSAPGSPLVRIDPATNRVAQRFTGPGGGAVVVAHQAVWVAAGPSLTWRLDPKLVASLRP